MFSLLSLLELPRPTHLHRCRIDRRCRSVHRSAFNNTTCFDLAQVHTFGNELRALASMGASPRQVLGASWPAVLVAAAGAVVVWWLLDRRLSRPAAPRAADYESS